MRTVTQEMYGVPAERVIGSSNALRYQDDSIIYQAEMDVFDDGPVKPVRIWSRIGARPLIAVGNSNGDTQCSSSAAVAIGPRCACSCSTTTTSASSPTRREPRLERAKAEEWAVVSMKTDRTTVFEVAEG
jgi:hypothetical protein